MNSNSQSSSPSDLSTAEMNLVQPTVSAFEDLLEANAALQVQNGRLVAEVTRLKTDVADLSYGKLTSAQPISPEPQALPAKTDYHSILHMLIAISSDPLGVHPSAVAASLLDLAASGSREEARLLAELIVRMSPGKADMHMRWVRQLRYHKEFDLALSVCNGCFAADGDSQEIRLNRGYLLYEAGYYEPAAEDLEIAGNKRPNSIEEKLVAASARQRLKQPSKAAQRDLMENFFEPAGATFFARSIDPDGVKRSLARHGCAWIKGLFDPRELSRIDGVIASNIAGMGKVYRKLGLPDNFGTVGFPLYFASKRDPEACERCYEKSYPGLFDPGRMAGVDNTVLPKFVFESLRSCGLGKVIRDYLGMSDLYVSAAACHIRSMVPQGLSSFGEFHQDNRLYNSDAEILTLWFPFRYQHGPMPSLEFLAIRSDSHLPCVSVCGIDNEMFDPGVFWRPDYELGDAMLLSGFSPHRTYFEAGMTLERTSIDFRIFASPLPEPIFDNVRVGH